MGPTGSLVNAIQIHPTLRCNLRCRHCYSASGPDKSGELPLEGIVAFLSEAVSEGFNAIAVSGGEPFMWRPLAKLVQSAHELGLSTAVTTNGLLLDAQRLARLQPHLSLLAVSIDGAPENHDRLRGLEGALARTRRKLRHVRDAGIPFGIIFTLTLENLDELAWVAEFAAEEGARLLQVHPLERVGRAMDYALHPPDDIELAFSFVEVARLQKKYRDRLTLQFDVADRNLVEREPYRAFAIPTPDLATLEAARLADLVSPLVLQDDGWIVPVQHGFDLRYAIAHLDRGGFREQAASWKRERCREFLSLSRGVWEEIRSAPAHLPFTNWYGAITERSSAP